MHLYFSIGMNYLTTHKYIIIIKPNELHLNKDFSLFFFKHVNRHHRLQGQQDRSTHTEWGIEVLQYCEVLLRKGT